jgi:hypothetical protein
MADTTSCEHGSRFALNVILQLELAKNHDRTRKKNNFDSHEQVLLKTGAPQNQLYIIGIVFSAIDFSPSSSQSFSYRS